jgi:hypothetical protein
MLERQSGAMQGFSFGPFGDLAVCQGRIRGSGAQEGGGAPDGFAIAVPE